MIRERHGLLVVCGASHGIGRAIGRDAASRGFHVALMARSADRLRDLEQEIVDANGSASSMAIDVTDPESVEQAFALAGTLEHHVRAVINCAGTVEPLGPLAEMDPHAIANSIQTNVTGTLFVMRASIRAMRHQDVRPGTIVNVTSGAARNPYSGWSCYCSGKAAVDMATACVAQECQESTVRVFAVSPGPFESGMQEKLRAADPSDFPAQSKFLKLHRDRVLPDPEVPGKILVDLALCDWPDLHGRVVDLRDADFRMECESRGIRTLSAT